MTIHEQSDTLPPGRRPGPLKKTLRRWAFWTFAALLFTLTHWPNLEIRSEVIERPDLLAHFSFFGAWYILLFGAAYFGRPGTARSLLMPWVLGVAYAGVDEALQAVPAVHRHAAWDDWAFDVIGVTLGLAGACAWIALRCRGRTDEGGGS